MNKLNLDLEVPKMQEVVEKIAYQQLGEEQMDDLIAKMGILNDYLESILSDLVKELEWREAVKAYPNDPGISEYAMVSFGDYTVGIDDGFFFFDFNDGPIEEDLPTIEAAKAAAQRHFSRKVMECLKTKNNA